MTSREGLVVDDLSVGYFRPDGTLGEAVSGVSLSIAPGESLALVGESGCGKSTIALAVTRLLPPSAAVRGSVRLDGTDVLRLDGRPLRRWWATDVAMVFQDPQGALDPTMRVGAQLGEVLTVLGAGRAEARAGTDALLRRVALDPAVAGRYPHQLSGGQQQRVVIAMALVVQPRLLVLDEPTTGLDATVEAGVLELVDELRRELSSSVLYITHDLGIVDSVADRVAVVYAGEVVEEGAVGDVLAAPRHPYSKALLAAAPAAGRTKGTDRLPGIPGVLPAIGTEFAGCRFAARCPHAAPACGDPVALVELGHGRRVRCVLVDELPSARVGAASEPVAVPAPRAPEPDRVLEVVGVTKRYGAVAAVDDVSLGIGRGEVVGLVGGSGSGKSTLAHLVTGLTRPDSGTVLVHGAAVAPDIGDRPDAARLAVQMVFQHPAASLNPRQRVGDILGRALHKLGGSRTVEQLADECHIAPGLLRARAGTLSGGQQQRVAIARAIAGDPDVVVCDEPVSSLDVSVQAGILSLLVELQRNHGTSLLFISHDLAVVEYVADRIAVMDAGRIVEEGTAADVLARPTHPVTADLLAARQSRSVVRDGLDPASSERQAPVSGR